MRLSISNIAWDSSQDVEVYKLMGEYGFTGLEIAPTRFFPEKPYDNTIEAVKLVKDITVSYSIGVCSMQSILFGKTEKIFESAEYQQSIYDYLCKAIDFAGAISCKNLVFGSPKNRCISKQEDYKTAVEFFGALGDYALKKGTVMAIEANPGIYGTNFINYTAEAVQIVKDVNSKGFRVNLDYGTIIENRENLDEVNSFVEYINHVHISEPGLLPICRRDDHKRLASILRENEYDGFISIEMKNSGDNSFQDIEKAMDYVSGIFRV